MTTNEIIKEIAVYNGYIYFETLSNRYFHKEGIVYFYSDLKHYITDLNILHRVAVKVYGEMQSKITESHKGIDWDASSHCNTILYSLLDLPINGEYITLATATTEAIVYLKKYKA